MFAHKQKVSWMVLSAYFIAKNQPTTKYYRALSTSYQRILAEENVSGILVMQAWVVFQ